MFINIFLYCIILIIKIKCDNGCSSNCISCDETKTKCIRCKDNYVLKGTFQFSTSNEITCVLASTTASNYYQSYDKVYYPCTNNDYVYLRQVETECYRRDTLSITNFYTTDDKHYYPCDESYGSINGIENCNRCKLNEDKNALICLNCKYSYAFLNKVRTECKSIEELINDRSIYKEDDENYMSCNIDNCIYCSSKHVCTECATNYFFKNDLRTKCFLQEEITPLDEYYLYDDKVYYLCSLNKGVEHCQKCSGQNHCTKCEKGFAILDDDYTQCIKISELTSLSNYYYTHDGGENYYTCSKYDTDNKHCLMCEFPYINNFLCLKCDTDYYFLEGEGDSCFLEETITNKYYKLNRNIYNLCSGVISGCDTCENTRKCLTCIDSNKGILDDDFLRCQEISTGITDNTIYKDQENNFYYTCAKKIKGCIKCTDGNTCINTISSEYCILDDYSVYKLNSTSDIYYYSTSGNDECILCNANFPNCLLCLTESNCVKCEDGYALIDKQRCDYIATYSINEEYFSDDNNINFYKCDNKALTSNAIDNCLKCLYNMETKINSCYECNTGYIILDDDESICVFKSQLIIDQIDNNRIVPNEISTKFYTCYKYLENCDTCSDIETCTTCKFNYAFLDDNKTACILKDDLTKGHFYTNDNGVNYYSCLENCFKCDDSTLCIKCDDGYELSFDQTTCNKILITDQDIRDNCIYVTEEATELLVGITVKNLAKQYTQSYPGVKNYLVKYEFLEEDAEYTILIFKNYKCSLLYLEEDGKLKIDTEDIIKEFKKYINNNEVIQAVIFYKNHTTIHFYEDNSNANEYNIQNICPSCLQKKYKVKYNYENKLSNELGPKFIELIKDKKVDVFNELSLYFQDFCENLQISGIDIPLTQRKYLLYQGNSSYNLGVQTKGNLFACDINCTLVKNIPEELSAECECDIEYDLFTFINNAEQISEINYELDVQKQELKDEYNFLDNSNDAFSMFTCANNAFTGNNIKSNPGFYTVTTCVVIQSLFFISLLFKQNIGSFGKLLVLANPPKGTNELTRRRTVHRITDKDYILTQEEEKNKYNYVNIETNTIIPKSKLQINNTSKNGIDIKDISNSNNNSEKSDNDNGEIFHQRMNIYNGNNLNLDIEKDKNSEYNYYPIMKFIKSDINVYRNVGYTENKKDIKELKKQYEGVKMIKYNLLFKNEKDKILPLIYKPLLKDFLPFKAARYYDKRSFGKLYRYFLYMRHPIINLCISGNNPSNNFIPFSVKAIKIIFIGILMLFFNSLLITQKYLYDKFNFFNKKYNFKDMQLNDDIVYSEKMKYAISHSIGNSFYTYLIIFVIDIVLSLVLSVRFRIKNLLDEFYEIDSGENGGVMNKNKKEQKNFEKELLKASDIKNIFLWTTVVLFVFIIAFFIYIINFCFSYKGEIPDLFFASFWSFLFYVIMPFFMNIFLAGFRILALVNSCEIVFELTKILIET